MPYWRKRQSYRDPSTAQSYDERRFSSPLQRIKHRRDVALLRELLAPLRGSALVLDAPCGTGRLIEGLCGAGWRVIGLDASAEMIACARNARDGAKSEQGKLLGFVQGELERLPLRARSIEALVSLRFFFHVDDRSARQAILREMARVTSGWVVIQERHRGSLKNRLRGLRRMQPERGSSGMPSIDQLSEELGQAGLLLERAVPVSSSFSDKLLLLARPAPASKQIALTS